jgi:hypothetical protein
MIPGPPSSPAFLPPERHLSRTRAFALLFQQTCFSTCHAVVVIVTVTGPGTTVVVSIAAVTTVMAMVSVVATVDVVDAMTVEVGATAMTQEQKADRSAG